MFVYASKVTGLDDSLLDEQDVDDRLRLLHQQYPSFCDNAEVDTLAKSITTALDLGLPLDRSHRYCSGLGHMLVFSPDENIYSCWECVGNPKHSLGTYDAQGQVSWNTETTRRLEGLRLCNNPTCVNCPYVLLCRSGCHIQAGEAGLDYAPRRCGIFQNRFQNVAALTVDQWLKEHS